MASFIPVRTSLATLLSIPVVDGQLICVYDTKRVLIDNSDSRYLIAGTPSEVTKFLVYATDADIKAGTSDSYTGLVYAVAVPAGMTHVFKLRSDTPQAKQDVIIDWGDGSIYNLLDGDFDSVDDSEFLENGLLVYSLRHTYSVPGRYIVTIHGKQYWGFQTVGDASNPSILSRIFATDLPIASCVTNLSCAARRSLKLQRVRIPTGMDFFSNINNATVIFLGCKNLLSATNFSTKFQHTRYVQQMFHSCLNMVTCDFRIPPDCLKEISYRQVFYNCPKLAANIQDLLPERGFNGTNINFMDCFRGCKSLTGTIPASILWGDIHILWSNTTNVFTGCSALIRAQAPVSWGGTLAQVLDIYPITRSQIGPIVTSKVDLALQNLNIQAGGSTGVGNITGGYAVRILSYLEITVNSVPVYTLHIMEQTDLTIDWLQFQAGQSVRISVNDASTLLFVYVLIAAVDSANSKLTLAEPLHLLSGTSLGMLKRLVSNYTSTATGGISAYRVTLTGAGSDTVLCLGLLIYTRAGTGAFIKNSIQGTSGDYIFLSQPAAAGTNAIYLPPANAIVSVATDNSDTVCFASGLHNMVIGQAASAIGALNVVSGDGASAAGRDNKVFGNLSVACGTDNIISGSSVYVVGTGNTVADSLNIVLGDRNLIYKQGSKVFGSGNIIVSVDSFVAGFNNRLKAYGAMAIGSSNLISGKYSMAVGYRCNIGALSAYVVGRYAVIPDGAENKNGFFVWGGHQDNNDLAFSVRVFRKELNPAYDGSKLRPGYSADDPNPMDDTGLRKYLSVPGYKTLYKGQLKPVTQTIEVSLSLTVVLDPTLYSRVMLTGSGTVTFGVLSYALDGDKVLLVFDSGNITPVFPALWVTKGIDTTTTSGIYVLLVAKIASNVFYKVLYP